MEEIQICIRVPLERITSINTWEYYYKSIPRMLRDLTCYFINWFPNKKPRIFSCLIWIALDGIKSYIYKTRYIDENFSWFTYLIYLSYYKSFRGIIQTCHLPLSCSLCQTFFLFLKSQKLLDGLVVSEISLDQFYSILYVSAVCGRVWQNSLKMTISLHSTS